MQYYLHYTRAQGAGTDRRTQFGANKCLKAILLLHGALETDTETQEQECYSHGLPLRIHLICVRQPCIHVT